jgi:2-dehydropantoate 2-reductase
MLQDVMRGRRTEVDHLKGYVAAEGRRLGVPAPLNAAVVDVFRALGATVKPDPGHLEPLYRLVHPPHPAG